MLPLPELRSEEICSGVIKEQESVAKSADPFIFFRENYKLDNRKEGVEKWQRFTLFHIAGSKASLGLRNQ